MPKVNDEYFENKRKEIIEAAYRVCSRKPITSVVMKDVIAEAGFSHGVIYKYYSDLDEVLRDLVITINSENRIDARLDAILKNAEAEDTKNWKNTIHQICNMLAEQMTEIGTDLIKISLYSDMLAMSDPERVNRITKNLDKDTQSPLLYLIAVIKKYLYNIIKKEALKPVKTVDEILQFIIVTYHGIQTGYVLSKNYDSKQLQGQYQPKQMFSCLADGIIAMLDSKDSKTTEVKE